MKTYVIATITLIFISLQGIAQMPNRLWGQYWAGYYWGVNGAGDDGKKVITDSFGNSYLLANWSSNVNYVFTRSMVIKYDPDGNLLWQTILGKEATNGTYARTYGYDIAIDNEGFILITGKTNAISTTSGVHQTSFGGNYDAFISKINNNGTSIWTTYYGGTGLDYAEGIAYDSLNNIYITGQTTSTASISSTGSHQTSNKGNTDAFIAKLNKNGVRLWGTYFGGAASDYGVNICTDDSGYVSVTGTTFSSADISTTGSHQENYSNSGDAFIARFDKDGTRQWSTYYGDLLDEVAIGITTDKVGNIYMLGNTSSTSNIASIGAFQSAPGGGNAALSDAFLLKISPDGTRQWCTYYGGDDVDLGTDLACDNNNNVYITGKSLSLTTISTDGSFQGSNIGGNDAFLLKLNSEGNREWCSYFGGSGTDVGNGITVDSQNNIFLVGTTGSSSGIATSGTIAQYDDAFIAKFENGCLYGPSEIPAITGTDSLCSNSGNITYSINAIAEATGYLWSVPGDAIISSGQDSTTITIDFGFDSGSVTVTPYNTCGNGNSAGLTISIQPIGADIDTIYGISGFCQGQSNVLFSIDSSFYPTDYTWSVPSDAVITTGQGSNSIIINMGDSSGYVSVSASNSCGVSEIQSLWVYPLSIPDSIGQISGELTLCANDEGKLFSVANFNDMNYVWSVPADAEIASGQGTETIMVNFGDSSGAIEVYGYNACESTVISQMQITINPIPEAPLTIAADTVCNGDSIFLSVNSGSLFRWTGPDNYISSVQNPVIPDASTLNSGTYYVTNTEDGCESTPAATLIHVLELTATASNTGPVCAGEQLILSGSTLNGASYSWTGPDNFSSDLQNPIIPSIESTQAGLYSLTISENGCTTLATTNVVVNYLPDSPIISWDQELEILETNYLFNIQWYLNGNILTGEIFPELDYALYSNTGTYTVRYTNSNDCSSISAPFNLNPNSLLVNYNPSEISIFPNPFKDYIGLRIDNFSSGNIYVEIFDIAGRKVFSADRFAQDKYGIILDLRNLENGNYTLRISTSKETLVKKLLKTH